MKIKSMFNKSYKNIMTTNIHDPQNKHCVIIHTGGGLGNQMFYYAYYRYLINKNINTFLHTSIFNECHNKNDHRQYKLSEYFGLNNIKTVSFNKCKPLIDFCNFGYSFKTLLEEKELLLVIKIFLMKAFNKLRKITGKQRVLLNDTRTYKHTHYKENSDDKMFFINDIIDNIRTNVFIEGCFQFHQHIDQIREIILSDFAFNLSFPQYIEDILLDIENTNSVAIHIRRGDYLGTSLNICGLQWYKNAIDYIKSKVHIPRFFLFSNDIEWVKKEFAFLENSYIVETIDKNGKIGDYYDMFLQSRAKHNIIPNSSFSWWAAYLNQNPSKIVVVPDKWAGDMVSVDDICPVDWIRIKT